MLVDVVLDDAGVWRNGIGWLDFEVHKDRESGAPDLQLHRAAAARAVRMGLDVWSLSISHDRSHALAFVVAMQNIDRQSKLDEQQ